MAFRAGGNEERTVAVALQQQGYRTALVGKYFNTFGLYAPPGYRPPGWDEFLAFTTMDRSGDYYDYTLSDGSVHGSRPRDYSTDVLAAAATDVVRTTPANQPLFLWYAPYAPHGPYRPAPGTGTRRSPSRPSPQARTSRPSRTGCRPSTRPSPRRSRERRGASSRP